MIGMDGFSRALEVKEGSSGHEHGAAGHTDGAAHGTHDVGVGEGRAISDEHVHVRCFDLGIAEGRDGVESLIVGEEEEDIGLLGSS